VKGRLYYEESPQPFTRLGESWSWDDESFAYSAQVSALNVNGNVVSVQIKPGKKVGDPVAVSVTPLPAT
jgi:D-alanyl-D-alanine carboxypeptidase/D-alanyl-D-alanine-endopeptidase (penicillin-binding protein 4)